jgi:hypothetical protein
MSDETERAKEIGDAVKAADAKKRADEDEAGGKIDKLLAHMDSLSKRMDAWDAKGAEEDEKKKADAAKKDADEIKEIGDPKEMTCDSRADSVEVRNELAAIQVLGDRAASAWSKSAPHPWVGELPDAYCRRLAAQHQQHSEKWGDGVNLRDLSGKTLRNAAEEIFADSIAKSCNPVQIGAGRLHEVRRTDPDSGHKIKEYYGDPMAWMSQFTGQRRTARFNFGGRRGGE